MSRHPLNEPRFNIRNLTESMVPQVLGHSTDMIYSYAKVSTDDDFKAVCMTDILRQAGAIPFRHDPEGLRVLLITSRDTGRWVIPKGGVEKGFTAAQAG